MPADARQHVVTIDGPAASGKSSTALHVAQRLGVRHADSGALYRGATAARLRIGGEASTWTEQSVIDAVESVSFVPSAAGFEVRLHGAPANRELYGPPVTARVSVVARMPRVRAWVNERMRECARGGPIVVDGRDMGTAVFPDAVVKVFLVADASVRAHRRSLQRLDRLPTEAEVDAEVAAIKARDATDATQTQRAPDAVVIDTTSLTPEEQVERIVALAMVALGTPPR